jgi:SAM-dependent methyltransferase
MSTRFDPEVFNRTFREHVAIVYGDTSGKGSLDDRQLFYLEMLARIDAFQKGKHLVDLAPGLTAFGPVAAGLGMKVTLIDDYGGGGGVDVKRRDAAMKIVHGFREKLGVCVEEMDFLTKPLPIPDASVDVITCFHSLEHWHNSPKPLFREIIRVLKPGGHLIIATPNAVNLRKRLLLPFGMTNYGALEEWYHDGDPVYRGHVREPIVRDLHRLMEWNGLKVRATYGRNFIGKASNALGFIPRPLMRFIASSVGTVTRFFPTLCSDIHVVGQKSA